MEVCFRAKPPICKAETLASRKSKHRNVVRPSWWSREFPVACGLCRGCAVRYAAGTDIGEEGANMADLDAASTPAAARAAFRAGQVRPTCGVAQGYAQANLMILPKEQAFDFLLFAQRNPKPCTRRSPSSSSSWRVRSSAVVRSLRWMTGCCCTISI